MAMSLCWSDASIQKEMDFKKRSRSPDIWSWQWIEGVSNGKALIVLSKECFDEVEIQHGALVIVTPVVYAS